MFLISNLGYLPQITLKNKQVLIQITNEENVVNLMWTADISLQNPKDFRTFEPFKFSNAYRYPVEKFSNATFFRQKALQNLRRKNLGFSDIEISRRTNLSSKLGLIIKFTEKKKNNVSFLSKLQFPEIRALYRL